MKTLIPIFLFFLISCETNRTQTKVEIIEVFDSAYGYQFGFPSDFSETKENLGLFNQFTFESPNEEAKLIYFIDEVNEIQDLNQYLSELKSGVNTPFPELKFSKVEFNKEKNGFTAHGNMGQNEVLYKAFVSQQSVFVGTVYVKTMVFIYPKQKRKHYEPLGISIAEKFRDY